MNCAVYCRKSTGEVGADADAKSVQRQTEGALAFATARGWTVLPEHIYTDDGISGAETHKLVSRRRLLDTIHGGAPFQALIMRDTSRFSRRDGDEAFGELKAIDRAGVEVWFYQESTRFTHGTFGDNVVGFVKAEAAADYRRQIAAWTRAVGPARRNTRTSCPSMSRRPASSRRRSRRRWMPASRRRASGRFGRLTVACWDDRRVRARSIC